MAITRNVLATAIADAGRFVKSKRIDSAVGVETVGLISVPKKAFIETLWIEIITEYPSAATTETLLVGFVGNGEAENTSFFADSTVTLPEAAGLKAINVSKYFETAGGIITVTTDRGDAASGVTYRLFADYEVVY
jgi:hypothetical protein